MSVWQALLVGFMIGGVVGVFIYHAVTDSFKHKE